MKRENKIVSHQGISAVQSDDKIYVTFCENAMDQLKAGGDVAKAQVWATLALAEATILGKV